MKACRRKTILLQDYQATVQTGCNIHMGHAIEVIVEALH